MLCVESQTQKSIFWVINSPFWNLGAHLNDQTVDLERSLLDLHTMFSQLLHTLSRECFLHPASSLYFNSSFSVVQNFDIDLSESAKRSSTLGAFEFQLTDHLRCQWCLYEQGTSFTYNPPVLLQKGPFHLLWIYKLKLPLGYK